jgi:type IV pilus assembly protein PilV
VRVGHIDWPRPGQRGVSLIEILVALLVVSFGVLAMSGLLGTASRYGKTSEYRGVATLLAADIADRMRANRPALNSKAGGSADAYDIKDDWELMSSAPDAKPCGDKADCAAAEMAEMDKAEWRRALYFALPNGMGYVSYSPDQNAADVWVAWLDPVASSEEAEAGDGQRQECPKPFQGKKPQPRCLYFRVGT